MAFALQKWTHGVKFEFIYIKNAVNSTSRSTSHIWSKRQKTEHIETKVPNHIRRNAVGKSPVDSLDNGFCVWWWWGRDKLSGLGRCWAWEGSLYGEYRECEAYILVWYWSSSPFHHHACGGETPTHPDLWRSIQAKPVRKIWLIGAGHGSLNLSVRPKFEVYSIEFNWPNLTELK